jgi:hypothetical protein
MIRGYLQPAEAAGVTWEHAQAMSDAEADAALFRDGGRNVAAMRAPIDYAHVHKRASSERGDAAAIVDRVSESVAARSDGTRPYQYRQLGELYGAWRRIVAPTKSGPPERLLKSRRTRCQMHPSTSGGRFKQPN